MDAVRTLARKEVEDHLRNGWVLAVALAFAVFALVIALAGFGFAGQVGPADAERTLVSLTSLVLYLIPLLGLLLGYDGIVGEEERGTLALLFSYPLGAGQLLLGKLAGLSAVLALALALGLAAPAALSLWAGSALWPWLAFAACAAGLGVVFIALALLLSTLGRERATVLGLALALWLVLVLLFDLGLLGLLVATGGDLPQALVSALFYLNPASLFRVLSLSLLLEPEALAQLGLGAQGGPPAAMAAGLAAWCALPALAAALRLRRAQ